MISDYFQGFAIGGAMGMFFSAMRYDAPGAFALPGGAPGMGGFNPELKWHRALYVGLKDMGASSLRTAKVLYVHPSFLIR
jgi:hypothetical protein